MKQPKATRDEFPTGTRSPYDPEPVAEEDLWFLPSPEADEALGEMPWPVAAREGSLEAEVWRQAEARQYRGLLSASQAVVRFAERMRHAPEGVLERFAILSVSAVLRNEGVWLSPEKIALYRALRVASDDDARDLARASWAVRRLLDKSGVSGPQAGLHGFLGRESGGDVAPLVGEHRPVGIELEAISDHWLRSLEGLKDCAPLTQAGFGFALWRSEGITPWDDMLEPTVSAMLIGAEGLAPFLPMAEGQRLDRHGLQPGAGGAEARLATFYAAVEAGAVGACLELDRLTAWEEKARAATRDLSGRIPPALIDTLLRSPVVSAELVADHAKCSPMSARRNLNLFADRGLVREVTGQDRYRFWTVVE